MSGLAEVLEFQTRDRAKRKAVRALTQVSIAQRAESAALEYAPHQAELYHPTRTGQHIFTPAQLEVLLASAFEDGYKAAAC